MTVSDLSGLLKGRTGRAVEDDGSARSLGTSLIDP
jgi:hypothetical protein